MLHLGPSWMWCLVSVLCSSSWYDCCIEGPLQGLSMSVRVWHAPLVWSLCIRWSLSIFEWLTQISSCTLRYSYLDELISACRLRHAHTNARIDASTYINTRAYKQPKVRVGFREIEKTGCHKSASLSGPSQKKTVGWGEVLDRRATLGSPKRV